MTTSPSLPHIPPPWRSTQAGRTADCLDNLPLWIIYLSRYVSIICLSYSRLLLGYQAVGRWENNDRSPALRFEEELAARKSERGHKSPVANASPMPTVATIVVIAVGLALRLSMGEWCWIVLAITSVWTAEALNTAFEFLTDIASPDFHPIAEKAKDVAAGAVLLAASGSVAIGALVLGPHVLVRLK